MTSPGAHSSQSSPARPAGSVAGARAESAGRTVRLSRRQRRLLEAMLAGRQPSLVLLSGTRVDTGGWLGRRRVLVCVAGGRLVLAAPGKRPRGEHVDLRNLRASRYNHVTGELALAPSRPLGLASVRLKPLDAKSLLDAIEQEVGNDAGNDDS